MQLELLKSDIDKLYSENFNLNRYNKELEKKLNSKKSQIRDKDEQCERLRNEFISTDNALKRAEMEITVLISENNALKDKLEALNADNDKIRSDNSRMTEILEKYRTDLMVITDNFTKTKELLSKVCYRLISKIRNQI